MSGASRLLTVKEVSERTGVQLWRSYELLKRGEGPPHLRTARVIRIPEKAVDQWIEEETQRTSATAARKRAAGSAWFRPGPGASHSRPATAPTTCAEKRSSLGLGRAVAEGFRYTIIMQRNPRRRSRATVAPSSLP
jgi:excisionase family DNA binding protein